jgi:hypothetical protein
MASSFKDALKKSGLAAAEPTPPAAPAARPPQEELPDDESLPPRWDAPALTRTSGSVTDTKRKA